MTHARRIVCQCGGEMPRPMPHVCPHCGRVISSVRRSAAPVIMQLITVIALFGAMIAFLTWLLSR